MCVLRRVSHIAGMRQYTADCLLNVDLNLFKLFGYKEGYLISLNDGCCLISFEFEGGSRANKKETASV